MSDIDAPSHIPRQTGEAATRVTRTSTTSDDSSAEQQSGDNKTLPPEKTKETPEKPAVHETAVTISANLSSLEAGGRVTAEYIGIDGQGRPLISSESGTYTVTYDPKEQPEIERIPRGAILEIKILKVDRQIDARLIFHDPTAKSARPAISLAVTLELTSLGDGPPRPRPTAGREHLPIEQQKISYQTTAVFRAENIARESASKLAGLPLPATTTNYTLYEKALPQENRPAIVRTTIAGNALIAQEQKQTQGVATRQAGTGPASPGESLPPVRDIRGLLNKNTLATVIKTFPVTPDNLPEIIRRQIGPVPPRMVFEAGRNFTLRIDSIAIPDSRPAATPPTKVDNTQQPPVPAPESPRQVTAAQAGFSGIIITPGQNILPEIPGKANVATAAAAKSNPLYPNRYSAASSARPESGNEYRTLYVATPVSIIKFQSPVELKAGTVINFSLPESPAQTGSRTALAGDDIALRQNIPAPESQPADQTIAAPVARPGSPPVAPAELPPQPLETFIHNWQSLSQILSVMSVGGSSMAQSLNNRLPGIENPARMTTGMIFFLAAIGAKTPAKIWLGPDITRRLKQAGQEKLLQKLDNDMQRIFRLGTATTAPHDWRPALLPLHIGGDVTAIPILTRQMQDDRPDGENGSDREGEDRDKTTRFIVELDLSQFGQIQLDGLLKDQKLNIIIRAGIKLPPDMKASMTDMFTTALDISGYSGDLQFRDNSALDISVRNIINQRIHMTGV